MRSGVMESSGEVKLKIIRPTSGIIVPASVRPQQINLKEIVTKGFPLKGMSIDLWKWKYANLPNLWRGLRTVAMAKMFKLPTFCGALELIIFPRSGPPIDL